jgi:hypothetical protein
MGNIYFEQGKYPAAIKMYRMALDALPAAAAGPRARLMTNIGLAFVQLGQYGDAAAAFENSMDTAADHQVSMRYCTEHGAANAAVLHMISCRKPRPATRQQITRWEGKVLCTVTVVQDKPCGLGLSAENLCLQPGFWQEQCH